MNGVYIIRGRGKMLKVGISHNLARRMGELQQATPHPLALMYFEEHGDRARQIEKQAHRMLGPWRMKGEWFSAGLDLVIMAVEAARDDCERTRSFFEAHRDAALVSDPRRKKRILYATRDKFPDLWSRAFGLEEAGIEIMEKPMTIPTQPNNYLDARRKLRALARGRSDSAQFAAATACYQLRIVARGYDSAPLRASLAANIERLKAA